jgi:hypothetical protein
MSADDQKLNCVNVCKDLQIKPQFLPKAITGDEIEDGTDGEKI